MWSPDGQRCYYTSNRNGAFNVWMQSPGREPEKITSYDGLSLGLPESLLYTKFALGQDRLVLPLEEGSGEIGIMRRLPE